MVQNTAGSLGTCLTELATNAIDAVIQREKNNLEAKGIEIPRTALESPQKFLTFALGEEYTNEKKLMVKESVLINKEQVLKDLDLLSPEKKVTLTLTGKGKIQSGIIMIQKTKGTNNEGGWQAKINRSEYMKWIKIHLPHTVWINKG